MYRNSNSTGCTEKFRKQTVLVAALLRGDALMANIISLLFEGVICMRMLRSLTILPTRDGTSPYGTWFRKVSSDAHHGGWKVYRYVIGSTKGLLESSFVVRSTVTKLLFPNEHSAGVLLLFSNNGAPIRHGPLPRAIRVLYIHRSASTFFNLFKFFNIANNFIRTRDKVFLSCLSACTGGLFRICVICTAKASRKTLPIDDTNYF